MAHSRDNSRFNRRLPDEVKDRIFAYAGREAYAAFQIARNAHEKKHALYEPFTYWDWHGADEEADWQNEDKRKRRLLWEREKGFRADGRMWSGYPFAQKRWRAFQYQINDSNRWCVKRIAAARWMSTANLLWIAQELPALEALDLSDWEPEQIGDSSTRIFDWEEVFDTLLTVQPRTLDLSDLDYFTCFDHQDTRENAAARLSAAIDQVNEAEPDDVSESSPHQLYLRELCGDLVEQQKQFKDSQLKKNPGYEVSDDLRQILCEAGPRNVLARLKWLGVSSWTQHNGQHPISAIVPWCRRLQTLSIRGAPGYQQLDVHGAPAEVWSDGSAHEQVCELVLGITQNVPQSVTTIELRRAVDFLPYLLEKLHLLKPTIKRVAIDLGAWIQMYPLRRVEDIPLNQPGNALGDYEIEITARSAAHYTNDIAEQTGHLPTINQSKKGSSCAADEELNLEAIEVKRDKDEECEDLEYKRKQRRFYADDGGSWINAASGPVEDEEETGSADPHDSCLLDGTLNTEHVVTRQMLKDIKINTLPRMLTMLYDAAHDHEISLVPLDPDPEDRSTNPIHPLALIQAGDECGRGCGSRYRDIRPGDDLTEIYKWLKNTFNWKPVFDWDWFMVPEKMLDTVDSAYQMMVSNEMDCLSRIEAQFRSLKNAGVPLHLLIGRRDERSSSCYWGWPYDEQEWKAWLDRPFDASLDKIASLVDSVSIFYDLRNPLDVKRLEDIDTMEAVKRPPAICPAVPCPWAKEGEHYPIYEDCPFITQRKPLGYPEIDNSKRGSQKMANKQTLKPKAVTPVDYARLANSCTAAPPAGQNANDHPSDDSDIDDNSLSISDVPLHDLARKAAFTREALGWQRFWSTYALKFTNLTLLRVRMPRCFDTVGSWRLAKLLDQKAGWQMLIYTDERQRMQTSEDLIRHIPSKEPYTFEHKLESKIWPAGRFVRRSWIWPETKTHILPVGEENQRTWVTSSEPTPSWGKRVFTDEDAKETQEWEEKEYAKASARAAAAALKEREAELSLEQMLEEDPLPLENRRRRKKLYHHALRQFAQRVWEQELQKHIDRLSEDNNDWPDIDEDDEGAQMEQSRLDNMIDWLKKRQKEDVPIFGEPQHDDLNDTGDIKAEMGWRDLGPLVGADWVQEQVTMYEATAAHQDVDFKDAGGLPVLISTDPEKRYSNASLVSPLSGKRMSRGEDLESPIYAGKHARLEVVSEELVEEAILPTSTSSAAGKRKRAGTDQSSRGKPAKQARFEDITSPETVSPTTIPPPSSQPATSPKKKTPAKASTDKRPPTPTPSKTSSKGRSRPKTASDLPSVPEEAPEARTAPSTEADLPDPLVPPQSSSTRGRKRKASSTTVASDPSTSGLPTPSLKKTKRATKATASPEPEPEPVPEPKLIQASAGASRKRKATPTPTAPSITEFQAGPPAATAPELEPEPPTKKTKPSTAKLAPTASLRDPIPSIDSPSPTPLPLPSSTATPDPVSDPAADPATEPDELNASLDPASNKLTQKQKQKQTQARKRRAEAEAEDDDDVGDVDKDKDENENELAASIPTSTAASTRGRGRGRGRPRGSGVATRGVGRGAKTAATATATAGGPTDTAAEPSGETETAEDSGRGSKATRAGRGGRKKAEPKAAVKKVKKATKTATGTGPELKSPVAGRTRSKRKVAGQQ